jgi:hypothetical protein
MKAEVFQYFQRQQRALARSMLPPADFDKLLHALTVELRQSCSTLDAIDREFLCQELGNQLQRELVHAASARHRQVLLVLLKKIERVKYQSPAR